jgi:hypothetical protein
MRKAYVLCEHAKTERCIVTRLVLESIGFHVFCIPYEKHEDKVYSNKISMQKIYSTIIEDSEEWSYVFEDDINKTTDITIQEIIEYEKISSYMFYLGVCMADYKWIVDTGKTIHGNPVKEVSHGCRGLHAIGLSKEGATALLYDSQNSSEVYMDIILEEFCRDHPANIVRFDLESPITEGHRGVIFQDRETFPSTI